MYKNLFLGTSSKHALTIGTNNTSNMHLLPNGYVGIGTSVPQARLDVFGIFQTTAHLKSGEAYFQVKPSSDNERFWLGTHTEHVLTLAAGNKGIIDLHNDGYAIVYSKGVHPKPNISQANKDKYSLFVLNGVLAEDFGIGPKETWSDYVFDKNYNLMDLSSVETFIEENKHLPNIPSAKEVSEAGYSLHDMNVKLLEKVEELTLYIINQNKRIDKLEKQVSE